MIGIGAWLWFAGSLGSEGACHERAWTVAGRQPADEFTSMCLEGTNPSDLKSITLSVTHPR